MTTWRRIDDEHWEARRHQAVVRQLSSEVTLILVWRRDEQPLGDEHFGVLQSAKNAIIGRDHFGFEVYPAESELRDRANVYWLHVFSRPGRPAWLPAQQRGVCRD